MTNELSFQFDNLPILTDLGFDAAPVDGIATIRFNEDGEWQVGDISLNGYKRVFPSRDYPLTGELVHGPVEVCPKVHQWLFLAILDRLENGAFKDTITDKVVEALDEMGIASDRDFSGKPWAWRGDDDFEEPTVRNEVV